MEENISREAGATAGQYTSAGRIPVTDPRGGTHPAERNTTYTRLNIKLSLNTAPSKELLEPEFA